MESAGPLGAPLVTVVIPSFNRADLVEASIQSVLGQTLQDFEIIVVDGGSSDGTVEVVESIDHPSIRLIVASGPTQGAAHNRNIGIRAARGKYVAFLDSDDLFLPEKLETQVAYLEDNPKVGLIYTSYVNVDEELNYLATQHATISDENGNAFKSFLLSCPVATPTVMVPGEVFEHVGLFDETMHLTEDNDMWIRIAAKYDVAALDIPLVKVRQHPANTIRDPDVLIRDRSYSIGKNLEGRSDIGWLYRRKVLASVYWQAYYSANEIAGYDDEKRLHFLRVALRYRPTSLTTILELYRTDFVIRARATARRVLPDRVFIVTRAVWRLTGKVTRFVWISVKYPRHPLELLRTGIIMSARRLGHLVLPDAVYARLRSRLNSPRGTSSTKQDTGDQADTIGG